MKVVHFSAVNCDLCFYSLLQDENTFSVFSTPEIVNGRGMTLHHPPISVL